MKHETKAELGGEHQLWQLWQLWWLFWTWTVGHRLAIAVTVMNSWHQDAPGFPHFGWVRSLEVSLGAFFLIHGTKTAPGSQRQISCDIFFSVRAGPQEGGLSAATRRSPLASRCIRWHQDSDLIPIGPLTFQPQQDRTHVSGCQKDDVSP